VEPVQLQAQTLGFANFLAQTDGVGRTVLALLLAMSVTTWYLIITKLLQWLRTRARSARFLESFWNAPSLQSVDRQLEAEAREVDEPFSQLARQGLVATRHHAHHGANKLNEAGTATDFLTRALRRVIDEETARLEAGLTVLASVGSTAPFVGLFGTVWGVYHALVAIGLSGQGTLDKVAGPVGEALIMTALGLAVAVPAVLAYNGFVRSNRVVLARLDSFAHDLFSFLSTGSHISDAAPAATTSRDAGVQRALAASTQGAA
jgi:biopolymer transport protein ExbB